MGRGSDRPPSYAALLDQCGGRCPPQQHLAQAESHSEPAALLGVKKRSRASKAIAFAELQRESIPLRQAHSPCVLRSPKEKLLGPMREAQLRTATASVESG